MGHSPPVYGSLLYSSLMVTTPPIANRSVPPQIRPCLASGSLQLAGLLKSNDDAANNNKRNKKRVVFADDRGRPLTQVPFRSFLSFFFFSFFFLVPHILFLFLISRCTPDGSRLVFVLTHGGSAEKPSKEFINVVNKLPHRLITDDGSLYLENLIASVYTIANDIP